MLMLTLLLVATLTTRFAFPLLSIEGRRAWIVLLAPIERSALIGQKLLVALPVALIFGLVAVLFSTRMLGVPGEVLRTSLIVAPAGAFALSGLAVGLGALFPNFKEDNPARIVSGFGGTLNFLTGMSYCGVVTLLLGAPSVMEALERIDAATRARWEPLSLAAVILLSLLVGLVPLALGRRVVVEELVEDDDGIDSVGVDTVGRLVGQIFQKDAFEPGIIKDDRFTIEPDER